MGSLADNLPNVKWATKAFPESIDWQISASQERAFGCEKVARTLFPHPNIILEKGYSRILVVDPQI
jgi:hypothetical protein